MASPQKTTWMILTFAFMMSIGVYCGLVLMLNAQPAPSPVSSVAPIRMVAYAIAAAGLCGSLFWSQTRLSGMSTPQRFQTDLILSLALAEIPTIAGLMLFFIGRKTAEFWPFAIVSVLIQALFILPRVLQRS